MLSAGEEEGEHLQEEDEAKEGNEEKRASEAAKVRREEKAWRWSLPGVASCVGSLSAMVEYFWSVCSVCQKRKDEENKNKGSQTCHVDLTIGL